jgi:membrane protein involved in colicin uptake
MTEAERYEGALHKPKNKKRNPQQEWMDIVLCSVDTAPAHLKSSLRQMSSLDNIPRKEKQFRNFTSNSLNLRGNQAAIVGEIWNLLKIERDKRLTQKELERKEEQAKKEQETQKQLKEEENKKALDEAKEVSPSSTEQSIDTKKVKKIMKKALKKAPKKSMKLKTLRKKVEDELNLSKKAKKLLKAYLLSTDCKEKSKIVVNGKIISLSTE